MALDRTWYNSLVDDDGSGLTGSVWDKTDVDALMDAVDAEIARLDGSAQLVAPLRFMSSITIVVPLGTIYNWAPAGGVSNIMWFLNVPGGGSSITGIVAEANGTSHLLTNITGNVLYFANADAGSLAANRLVCPGYTTFQLGAWKSAQIIYQNWLPGWLLCSPL